MFCDLDLQFQGHLWPLKGQILTISTPQPLRAVGVLFSTVVSEWAGGQVAGKVCPGCISENVRCRKLIHGRDID